MMRHFVAVSLMVAVLGGTVLAAGGADTPQEQKPMPMMQGGVGAMMAGGKIAAWNGNVYLLRDGRLEKLNSKLEVVGSAELPKPEMPMMNQGMMGGGMMGKPRAPAEQMPQGMQMRCMAMMRADIDASDPQAILALKDELKLTPDQVSKLQTMAQTAGSGAKDVLTDGQKAKVQEMEKTPSSMMKMEGPMRQHMMQMMGGTQGGSPQQQQSGGMMMGGHGMMQNQDPPAGPQERGGMMMGGMQQPMPMTQSMPPGMAMRCMVMMRAELDAYSPQALLALKDELKLTPDQVSRLQTIADTARAGADDVLTADQRSALKDTKNTPTSMMKMQGPMHETMMRMMGGGMMMGMMNGDQVAADGEGVYVLAGGRLTVYNHGLKEVRSKALREIAPKQNKGN